MAENYEILLGVKLDTSDIEDKISDASKNIKPIELKIDAETKELTNTIKEALNSLSKGTKNVLTLDTSKIESSLNDVTSIIREIKTAIGSLDNGSSMKSLVGSINSISIALDRASNKFDGLLADLKSLSGKDFNFNFGLNLGGSNSVTRQGTYGTKARTDTIPQLKQQAEALNNYLKEYYKVTNEITAFNRLIDNLQGVSKEGIKTKVNTIGLLNNMAGVDASAQKTISLKQQMEAYQTYINLIKENASLKGIDISHITSQFSKSADQLVQDADDVRTGAKEMEDSFEKLKQVFSGGSNLNIENLSVSLEPIVRDLAAIREAVESLSKGVSVDGLTQSFDRLSDTLDKLMTNAKLVQDVLGSVGSGANVGMSDVGVDKISQGQKELAQTSTSVTNTVVQNEKKKQEAYRETSGVIENLKTTLETMNVNKSSIDAVIKDMEELGFTATDTSVNMKDGGFDITVKGIDSISRAITEIRHLDNETDEISLVGRKITQSLTEADKFVKQQKNAVADLTNQINQLNRAATDQNANRPIKDSSHLDSLQSKYQEIIEAIQKMGNASSATFDDERNEVKRLINEYKSLKSEFKNAENVSMDFKGSDFTSGLEIAKNRLREFKSEAKGFPQVTQTVEQLDRAIEGVGDKSSLDKFNDQLRVAKSELKAVKAEVLSNNDNLATKIKIDIETEKFENKVHQLHDSLDQLTDVDGSLNKLRASIKQVDDAYDAMKTAAKANDDEALVQAQKKFAAAVEKTNNELRIQAREQRAANKEAKLADSQTALKTDMLNWLKKNSKATKEYKAEIDRLIASLDKLDQAGVNGVRRRFSNIDREAELKGLKGLNFLDSMKSKIKEYSVYFGAAELFMYAEQGLRDMFEQVKLIDSAMTELKKVTNETDAAYEKFLTNAASRAREIGTTIDGLVSSTADFARLGYGFEDAQGLAEVANIYAVVGDEINGVEGATESLISTMAAFKDEMNGMSNTDFAMSIIDKFNEIGNNFAISSGGIGEALERSASSLMAANNTIDESIALITAANTVVQDPEQVGTAFKTISMRIRGAKTELEEAGLETDGMVESTAKLRSEILALTGVDIMDGANQFKSTYAIMDELAAKWQDLTDIQQATVTELIAGKRQGNIVSSLMSNFDTAREALETSMNSAGSAMKEHEKWQQSLEAQILKLKASWQSLSQVFLSSDFLHTVLDWVINLVDGLTKLIDTLGVIPTILATFSSFKVLKTVFATLSKGGGLSSLGGILGLLQKSFPNITKGVKKLVTSLREVSLASGGAGTAFHGFLSLIMQHPYITATVIAVTALTGAFIYQKKKAEELAKEVDELTENYKINHEELQKLKGDYDTTNESSMISKYAKLSKGVDALGRNVSLTADEYSEYQGIVNQIADQIPSLISGYDAQGNALLSCKGNVEELTVAYEKLIHAQNQEILTNTGDIEEDFANTLDQASGKGLWSNGHGFLAGVIGNNAALLKPLLDYELKNDTVQGLKNLLSATSNEEKQKILKQLKTDAYSKEEIRDALESAQIDVGYFEDPIKVLENTLKTNPQKIKNIVDNYYTQFADAVNEQKTIAQAKLSEAFDISNAISGLDYSNINEELQTIAYQVVNGLDLDFFTKLQEQGKTVEQWTTELLDQLNAIGKTNGDDIKSAFELQTKFNGGDISYGQYIDQFQEAIDLVDKLKVSDEIKNQIKLSLNSEDVLADYNALVHDLKNIGFEDAAIDSFLNSLSAEEFSAAMKIVPNLDKGTTFDEIQSLIDEQLAEEFKFDIKVQTKGIEALNTALAESRSAAGLTSESIAALTARYKDLDGFNAAALFEKTVNGIRLNSDELSRLEEQYINTNKLEIDKNLNALVEKYQDVNNELKTNTSLTADERKELERSKESLADKIDELSTLASQYDGLTSAFTNWQNALNGAEEGDNYDSIFENLEAMKELDDKKLYGTDKYKTFAQLMSYEDLSSASIDKIGKAFDKGYKKAERYFTESKKGSTNFLNDLNKINSEWAHINKNGDWEVNINAEEAAKKLGISVEAVLLLLDKLKDYGIKVEVEDTSVDNLKTKIEKTEAKLKELGQSPVDINVDIEASSSNLGKIESEIEKAKSKIAEINNSSVSPEVKTAQLEDARAKLEALIQKKQEASQPAFMNLNTSQVNASLVDALEKIQSYQTALNELNELKELKSAGIAIDDSEIAAAEEKLDGFAKAIQGLDGDVKVAIGLEEDGSIDSIHKAFEEGKVKIDADTDPALTKIEQLAENVEKIEDKDVTINVTVNGLDQVKELNKQIDLATDIQGDIDKLSEYVENAKELNKFGNNITSYVTAEVKGNVIDTKEYKLNNLKVFGESAKEVKGLGTFTSKVTANVEGNVVDTKERKLDNLKVFTDSAKNIKEFEGNIISNITANTLGSVFTDKERNIDNLKVFIDSAKGIRDVEGNIISNITANTLGSVFENKSEEKYIDNLKTFIDSAKGIKDIEGDIVSNITANTLGSVFENKNEDKYIDNLKTYIDSAKGIKDIEGNIISSITANTLGSVFENKNEDKYIDNLKTYVDSAKGIKNIEGNIVSNITANTLGSVFTDSERTTDNLKTFIESANGIKDIEGDIISNITANTLGSVFTDKERSIDNLKVFIDSAKGIKDIEGDIVSNITANTLGDVFTDKERTIDNLKVFTESAKGIKDIEGDIVSNITANTLGSVFTNPERETDNLKTFTESAKGIKDIEGDIVSNITANTLGSVFENKNEEKYIDNLKVFVDSAKGLQDVNSKTVNITANTLGDVFEEKEKSIDNLKVFAEGAKSLQGVESKTVNITANTLGDVFTEKEKSIDNLKVFAEGAKALQGSASKTVNITANANGNAVEGKGVSGRLSSLTEFKSLVNGMTNQNVTVSVTAKVDSENVSAAIDLLKKVSDSGVFKDYKATVQIGAKVATIDDTTVKNYIATEKTAKGKVVWSNNDTAVNEFKNKIHEATGKVNWGNNTENVKTSFTATGKINWSNAGIPDLNGDGDPGWVNGTAHANGTAFKQGDWGIKGSGKALVGELGAETLVRDGKYYLIGQHGAEFIQYRPNDIIFNHLQTQELFSKGKVFSNGGRGKALVNGTAFASGTDSEAFDWFEIYIARLERVIDKLDKTVNDVYKSWSSRNTALTEEIKKVAQEIQDQQSGAEMYKQKAAEVGLNKSAKNMGYGDLESAVRDGSIRIDDIEDESIKQKINEYKELYEKQIACEDAAEELLRTQAELNAQKFDNIMSEYDGILEGFEHTESMIDEYISQAEAKGHLVSGKYYQALIDNNDNNIIPALINQRDKMIKARDYLNLDIDSEKYREMSNEIDAVTQEIEQAKTQTLEWQNEIRQINWDIFDLALEKMSQLNDEADFFVDLLSNKKLFNDDGSMTNEGFTTMGMHAQKHNTHMFFADKYKAEIDAIDDQIDALDKLGDYDQNLIDRRQELVESQRENILAAEDEKQAIKDLISEGYDKQLEALQDRIDLYTESIESAKDLYDYEKNVAEQTSEIASLQKQLRAYEGFDDEENRATVQKLKVELEKAQQDLQETEYDKFISDQSTLLDELYLEYETVLNECLDNLDGLIEDSFATVNEKADTINTTIENVAGEVGIEMSEELGKIWSGEGGIEGVVTGYYEGFKTDNASVIKTLGEIKGYILTLAGKSDKEAENKIKQPTTTTSATSNHSSGSSGGSKPSSSPTGNKSTDGDGKAKIGDKVKFLNGKYYYDSQGVNPAGSKNHGKYVYITNVNNKKWATHPIHISTGKKLGSGDLGWLKKSQISGYATGKKNFLDNEIAWTQENGKEFIVRPSDGAILTPIAKGDSVLNAQASGNIWNMANNPAEFIKDSLKLDATNVPNGSSVNNSCVQNFENITFSMPNVRNYEQLVSEMQRDPKFEKLILAMTLDQVAGKSKLGKNKAIR